MARTGSCESTSSASTALRGPSSGTPQVDICPYHAAHKPCDDNGDGDGDSDGDDNGDGDDDGDDDSDRDGDGEADDDRDGDETMLMTMRIRTYARSHNLHVQVRLGSGRHGWRKSLGNSTTPWTRLRGES